MNTSITRLNRVLTILQDVAGLPLDLATGTGCEAFDLTQCAARAASTALATPGQLHTPEASAFLDRLEAKATEAATLARCAYVERVCSQLDAPAAAQMARAARGAYALGRSYFAYVHALDAAQHARRAAKAAGAAELLELA